MYLYSHWISWSWKLRFSQPIEQSSFCPWSQAHLGKQLQDTASSILIYSAVRHKIFKALTNSSVISLRRFGKPTGLRMTQQFPPSSSANAPQLRVGNQFRTHTSLQVGQPLPNHQLFFLLSFLFFKAVWSKCFKTIHNWVSFPLFPMYKSPWTLSQRLDSARDEAS